MGTTWSRWLELRDGGAVFDKTRCVVDARAEQRFYASLGLAAHAIECSVADERAAALVADDARARAQLQYVLENWAREAGVLYDRVGDFPLILPLTSELQARALGGSMSATSSTAEMNDQQQQPSATPQPQSRDEVQLMAASHDKLARSDRVYEAMYRVAHRLPQDEFLRVVAKYPRAARLFAAQTTQAQMDAETPFRLWVATGQHAKAAGLVGKLAYGEESYIKQMGRLQEMAALLRRAEQQPTTTPRDRARVSFQRVMTEEMIALLDTQNRLENRLGMMHLVGSSVVETIEKLLTLFPTVPTALAAAVSVGADFHIDPTQFWWSLLKTFAASDQWRTLFLLSAAVPPPDGYTAIAEALVDARRTELAPELLAAISSPTDRDAVVDVLAAHAAATAAGGDGENDGDGDDGDDGGGGGGCVEYGYADDIDAPVMV